MYMEDLLIMLIKVFMFVDIEKDVHSYLVECGELKAWSCLS